MHEGYYQNTLYPLQDRLLNLVSTLPVDFYLTGGTALSRAYLHHRYSDDLDFFVNAGSSFKSQVQSVIRSFTASGLNFETVTADEGFVRIMVLEEDHSLKLDFVNDVPFRYGVPVSTPLFVRTDNPMNILSNKVTALGRYAAKDVVDIVYLCEKYQFNWEEIFSDAAQKDLWVNPIEAARILEEFPLNRLDDLAWIGTPPSVTWFAGQINQIISDVLLGTDNSLFSEISL